MALERRNCQTARHRSPSQFAIRQTGADCKFYYHFNGAILAVRLALYFKLPHLAGKSLDAVLVLPRKVVDFLYGVVDLLYAG